MWNTINTIKDRTTVFMWDGLVNGRVWIQDVFKADGEFMEIYRDHFWQPVIFPKIPIKSRK